MTKYKCKKCEHEWFGRLEIKPAVCPKCKQYDWNEPKKENDK